MFGYYGFDYYYLILVLPAVALAIWAQARVKSTFSKYSKVSTHSGMTGEMAAKAVLREHGITNVSVERINGELTDHFDPRDNVIRLSNSVYDVASVAAVGVAAHEAGHAVQHEVGYTPMKIRSAIIPMTQIGSSLSFPLLLAGLIFNSSTLVYAGIIFFAAATLFQLVTLPVEFNASSRAIETLGQGYLSPDELPGAKRTLHAAALTYVAALAVSLAQLLRLVLLFGGRRDD